MLTRDSDLRKYKLRSRKAITDIEAMGGCTIERLGNNPRNDGLPWRVMPPDQHWPPDSYPTAELGGADYQQLPAGVLLAAG